MSDAPRGDPAPLEPPPPISGDPPPVPGARADRSVALALFVLLCTVYVATLSGVYHSSDEMAMLATTDSLARRGAWDVELLRWSGEQQSTLGPDGHLYSRKAIGQTLAALPHYWLALQVDGLGNVQTAMLTNAVLTALTGVLVFYVLRRLAFGRRVALLTALAYGLGTMAWPYARYFYSETLAALGLMACFYGLLRFRDRDDLASVTLAGAGLGVALLARLNNALAAPIAGLLLLVYLYRRHGRHWRGYILPVLCFGLPLLAALGVTGWYNWLRFGDPLTTGYLPEERFSTPFFEGLYGLTLSAGRGLFWYNPILIAAAAAWPAFYKRGNAHFRAEALLVAAMVVSTIGFYAPWYLWWGGHAWGPRFLVSLLPFAALPLAAMIDLAARRRGLALALGLVVLVSGVIQMLGVAVNPNLYLDAVYARLGLYHPATLFDPAYSPLVRQWAYLRGGSLDLAWTRIEPGWVALLFLLGAILLVVLSAWSAWRRRPVWRNGWGLLALLVAYAAALLLKIGPGGEVAVAAGELAALEQPGEIVVLADSLLTEAFQNAYDGRLPTWGVPDRGRVPAERQGTWVLSAGELERAPLHFQAGGLGLALYPAAGGRVDAGRVPASPAGEAALGGVAALRAAWVGGERASCDHPLPVTLWWRALAPTPTSYTLFVQVIDQAGTKAGQVDRLPCGGGCPTITWQPGDLVGERYDVPIDCATPGGSYQVIAGLYDLATGERLPLLDAAGQPVGDHVLLGTVALAE